MTMTIRLFFPHWRVSVHGTAMLLPSSLCPFVLCTTECNENWTVEEALQWSFLRRHQAVNVKVESIEQSLRDCLNHEQQRLKQALKESNKGQQDPSVIHNKNGSTATSMERESEKPITTIVITILEGPHEGKSFELTPPVGKPCLMGRSKGKRFREHGVSLPQDNEVSTTHGKFEILSTTANNVVYFTDLESTNGTILLQGDDTTENGGIPLEPNKPYELQREGTKLHVGNTLCQIVLQ